MKTPEMDDHDLVYKYEQSCIDWDRLLSEPCPPTGRPPEWKRKLERLAKTHERLHAELLRRLTRAHE